MDVAGFVRIRRSLDEGPNSYKFGYNKTQTRAGCRPIGLIRLFVAKDV